MYIVAEQAVTAYVHRRSAKELGTESQNHETRKDSFGLSKRITRIVVQSHIYGLDRIKFK
jgi:hypothetical protein